MRPIFSIATDLPVDRRAVPAHNLLRGVHLPHAPTHRGRRSKSDASARHTRPSVGAQKAMAACAVWQQPSSTGGGRRASGRRESTAGTVPKAQPRRPPSRAKLRSIDSWRQPPTSWCSERATVLVAKAPRSRSASDAFLNRRSVPKAAPRSVRQSGSEALN